MFWIMIIALVLGLILLKFLADYKKDDHDLEDQTLEQKFSTIVQVINNAAFDGRGTITRIDKREFNLYEEGQNQLVKFRYGTGHLYLIWKFKYLQKEVVHERQIPDARNLSLFEQEDIANAMIKEMEEVVRKHKNQVNQGFWDQISKNDGGHELKQEKSYDSNAVQKVSLERLSKLKNLPIDELKEQFWAELREAGASPSNYEEALNPIKQEKIDEAERYNIKPVDTSAAFLERWLLEFINSYEENNQKSNDNDNDEEMISCESLDEALKEPLIVNRLELTETTFDSFPIEILELKNLTILDVESLLSKTSSNLT